MTVRVAKFADVPAMTEVMRDGHGRSIYADRATFNEVGTKQLLVQCVQRHGGKGPGATFTLVSETDGEVRGFIIGMLDFVYPCLHELMATDLMFLCRPDADPADPKEMLKQLTEWAEGIPRVIEIHLGVTNAVGDYERTGKLYTRMGFQQCGAMFQRGLER